MFVKQLARIIRNESLSNLLRKHGGFTLLSAVKQGK